MVGRDKDNLSIKMYLTLTLIVPAVSSADYRLQCGAGAALQNTVTAVSPLTLGAHKTRQRCQDQEEPAHYMMII